MTQKRKAREKPRMMPRAACKSSCEGILGFGQQASARRGGARNQVMLSVNVICIPTQSSNQCKQRSRSCVFVCLSKSMQPSLILYLWLEKRNFILNSLFSHSSKSTDTEISQRFQNDLKTFHEISEKSTFFDSTFDNWKYDFLKLVGESLPKFEHVR